MKTKHMHFIFFVFLLCVATAVIITKLDQLVDAFSPSSTQTVSVSYN